ncbi:MAG: hypothetical protein FJ116_09980 [Deltaproteobacteria bacterium]|nr:hypothetical protein [Deltaproteobacteria bacterium]
MVGCASPPKTGSDFNHIGPGMTQAQVMEIMGNPDSFTDVNGHTVWQWNYRPVRDLTFSEQMLVLGSESVGEATMVGDRTGTADYYVIYKQGRVVQKGTGNPRQSPILNVNMNATIRHRY